MSSQLFRWGSRQSKTRLSGRQFDRFWLIGLFLAAILLFCLNLGGLPLRDWDEGIAGQVAREMNEGALNWLYPTIGGTPYLNKPPLIHWLIALCFRVGGVQEWTARLAPALLSALSVPLLYALGRELFPQRLNALLSSLVYLTLLPVVRQGRLAMLDGAVLCFLLLMMWCSLRSRRNLRYALGAGIGFGSICLTKGILLGILLGAIAFLFLLWDTPRLLTSKHLWLGLAIGIVPVTGWYTAQWLHYGDPFLNANLVNQSWRRIWEPVGNHAGPPWYYLLEILESAWPWHLFWLQGLRLSWENRNFAWAKLVLVWTGVYLFAVSAMNTKLPWYILPIYPAFALAVGSYLAEIWQSLKENPEIQEEAVKPPSVDPLSWLPHPAIFALLAVVALAGCVYFGGWISMGSFTAPTALDLQLMMAAVALTMAIAAVLLHHRDRQFIVILGWGTFVSLLIFVSSNHWIWELAEDYPVKPVATLIRQHTPVGQEVFTSHPYPRPSLDFYSHRRVIVADSEELLAEWQKPAQPYFLLDSSTLDKLTLDRKKVLASREGWFLITREISWQRQKLGDRG